jgi:hypothetical protein
MTALPANRTRMSTGRHCLPIAHSYCVRDAPRSASRFLSQIMIV